MYSFILATELKQSFTMLLLINEIDIQINSLWNPDPLPDIAILIFRSDFIVTHGAYVLVLLLATPERFNALIKSQCKNSILAASLGGLKCDLKIGKVRHRTRKLKMS